MVFLMYLYHRTKTATQYLCQEKLAQSSFRNKTFLEKKKQILIVELDYNLQKQSQKAYYGISCSPSMQGLLTHLSFSPEQE